MDVITLEARPRRIFGKQCRYLRRGGITPANLYGAGMRSLAIQVDSRELRHILATTSRNTPVQIAIMGEEGPRTAFIWRAQRHPLSGDVLHIDLYHVEATHRMRTEVPLVLTGVDPDLEKFGKRVLQYLHAVTVETLPLDLPTEITVDCSGLTEIDEEVKVSDLAISDKLTLLTAPEDVIAKVATITMLAEAEGAEAEEAQAEPGAEEKKEETEAQE